MEKKTDKSHKPMLNLRSVIKPAIHKEAKTRVHCNFNSRYTAEASLTPDIFLHGAEKISQRH